MKKGKESFEMEPEDVCFILLHVFLLQKLGKDGGGYGQRQVSIRNFVRITLLLRTE